MADENWGEPLADTDPRQVGPYEIRGVLGSGAMGRVFLGRNEAGVVAAVKVIRADLADVPVFRKRFARELSVVRKIDGARVARVLDADAEARQPWIATERVEGPSLQSRIDEQGPLAASELRVLARDIAAALLEIHEAQVVHRDLKPSNVLLGPDGPKVIDFGVAHAADASVVLTGTGHVPGTPAYMSPEQAEAKDVGPKTDVFALGSLLVFAATGRLAFGDGPPLAVLNRVLNGQAELGGVADQDRELRRLIVACLAKDPEQRPTPKQIIEVCGSPATHIAEALPSEEPVPVAVEDLPTEPLAAAAAAADEPSTGPAAGAALAGTEPRPPAAAISGGPGSPTGAAAAGLDGADLPATVLDRQRGRRRRLTGAGIAVVVAALAVLAAALLGDGGGEHPSAKGGATTGTGGPFPVGATESDSTAPGGATAGGPAASSGGGPATSAGTAPPGGGPADPATSGGAQQPASPPQTATGTNPGPGPGPTTNPATKPPASTPATSRSTSKPPTSPPAPSPTTVPPKPMSEGFDVSVPPWFGSATVVVSWKAHADATSYDVHFTDDFGSGTDQVYHTTGTSYSIQYVAAGSTYCVSVRAVNQYGASAWYSPMYCAKP